jgi:hypothetical protein
MFPGDGGVCLFGYGVHVELGKAHFMFQAFAKKKLHLLVGWI